VGGNLQAALPRLSLYAVAGYRLLPALQRAFTAASRLKHNMPVLEKLHPDLYASLHDNFVEETNIEALPFHRDFILKNVSFHYENMPQLVLNNLNVTIKKGKL
jgi:ABC-type bacteriocin/lantibiotic exporter with double-glycine peptidase domain